MQPQLLLAPLTFFVACASVMGGFGCSPGTSTAAPVGQTNTDGTPATGGTPAISSTSGCIEGQMYPRTETFCSSDDDCATNSSCSGWVQGSSLTCNHGTLEPSSFVLVRACESYPSDCTGGSAIKSYLTDSRCTVMVRASADTDTVVGYAVNCGKPTSPTDSDVLGRLLQMNSVNWTGAAEITDPRTTGLIAFSVADGGSEYTAYFSAATGNQLLLTQTLDADAGTGSFLQDVVWHDAIDLGTSCSSSGTSNGPNGTNLIPALRLNYGPVDTSYLTPISVGQRELLSFFNAHCEHC